MTVIIAALLALVTMMGVVLWRRARSEPTTMNSPVDPDFSESNALCAELRRQTKTPGGGVRESALVPILCFHLYGRRARDCYDGSREIDRRLLEHLRRVPCDWELVREAHEGARRVRRGLIVSALGRGASSVEPDAAVEAELRRLRHLVVSLGRPDP
jgi:hypothetical protein